MISPRPAECLLKSAELKLGGFNLEPCVKFKMASEVLDPRCLSPKEIV